MKNQLLLIFLILTCKLQAQKMYALTPFEDYNNCTSGFLNKQGDTIWPAQFDRVMKPVSQGGNYSTSWFAVYQGKWGLLSWDGKVILPFEFSHMKMSHVMDIFFVFKDNKGGVFDMDGKELYPLTIDGLESESNYASIFKENGKYGVFGAGMQLTIPPKYDLIQQSHFYRNDDYGNFQDPTIYYLLAKDGKYGLADVNGKIFFENGCCPFDFIEDPTNASIPYLLTNGEKGVGLTTLMNETLLPPEYEDIYLFSLEDPQGHLIPFAHVQENGEIEKIYSIDRKQMSPPYDQMIEGDHAFIFQRKNKKGYLDPDLKEHYIKTHHELRFASRSFHFSEELAFTPELPFIPGSTDKCVLVLVNTEKTSKSGYTHDKSYGLIDVNIDKKIKPQFQAIWPKIVGNEVYYFAFYPFLEEDGVSTFKVYNSKLEIIDTFQLDNQYWINFNEFFRSKDDHPVFIFKNETGKFGGVGSDGKIVIPFVYDELIPQYANNYSRLSIVRIAARIDKKYGVISCKNEPLIPLEFDNIQPYPNNYQIAARPNGYVLYDSAYRKVIENCQFITRCRTNVLKSYNGYGGDPYLRDETFFAVKNDSAYAYFKDHFKLLNEQNFYQEKNETGITLVSGRLLVKKNGQCIFYNHHIQWASPRVYIFQNRDSIGFFHIHDGITHRVGQSTANTGIDSYIHVNQYPNKEGLVSKETGKWVLELGDYFKILTDGKKGIHSSTDYFWYVMKSDENKSHSMWTFDRVDKGKLERKFDLPLMKNCGEFYIARSSGKYGLLDKNYEETLPFEFKNIIYSHQQFFVKGFDDLWLAWSPDKGLIALNCTDISLSKFTNGRLIFNGDDFAFLTDSLTVLTPFIKSISIPDSVSLTNLLGPMIHAAEYYNWKNDFTDEYNPIGRVYNNNLIIELCMIYSTRHQVTEAPFLQNKTNALQPVLLDEVKFEMYEKRTLTYIGKRVCSYLETSVRRNKPQYFPNNSYKNYTYDAERKAFRNLVFDQGRFRPATLDDLFLLNVGYVAWLDNYLTKVINEKQLFGLQCMNLPSILEEYKQNFHLEGKGISFSLKNENKPIVIPWKDLKGVVKAM